ncbi:MAG: PIN domain-containing protein [Rhodospirillaceae bacterium]|nr:PIN domain-containing protein [Rhodospirillaceae bacterium]
MRVAIDTDILVYMEGRSSSESDAVKARAARQIVNLISQDRRILPRQTLVELFAVLIRKGGMSPLDARSVVLQWQDSCVVAENTAVAFSEALDIAVRHKFAIWDALILSVAAEARCRFLLSEDMADGFAWGGVTVVNPFAKKLNRAVAALLAT